MSKPEGRNNLGIYISPKEICISQVKLGKDSKPEPEHLIKFPTGFPVKEGMLRPLSLNHEFFSEKAPWVAPFAQAVKKVKWETSSAVVTLSPQFAILRYFVMPAVDRRFWNKSIPLESKKYIPVSFEEVVYDFKALPAEGGKKLGVLFGLTQRKSVEFISETLKSAGLALAGVETSPLSMERLFGLLDQKDHDARGYVHFSGNSSAMLFSHSGAPVLYRETESDSGGAMSERKRLDIKGAVQFVDRYVGGKEYKEIMLSGDGLEVWQNLAAKEAEPIKVSAWNASALCGLKDNDSASLLSCAAALRGRAPGPALPDISGLSTAATLEKKVQTYVWVVTFLLGGMLLLLSIMAQVRLYMASSTAASLRSKLMVAPELSDSDAEMVHTRLVAMQNNADLLKDLVSDNDPVAPKLQAIADNIPQDLWVTVISYSSPFSVSQGQAPEKQFTISGGTFLSGQAKIHLVNAFMDALKKSKEFKIYSPPFGTMDNTMGESVNTGNIGGGASAQPMDTSGFTIVCSYKRK